VWLEIDGGALQACFGPLLLGQRQAARAVVRVTPAQAQVLQAQA